MIRRALAVPIAVGGACASMVPIRLLAAKIGSDALSRAVYWTQEVLQLLLWLGIARLLVRLWQMARRHPWGEVRLAAAALFCAVLSVPVAIVLQEAGALSSDAGRMAALGCYGAVIVSLATLIRSLPWRPPWTTSKPSSASATP